MTDNQITNCGFAGIWTDWTKGDVEISGNTIVLESADTEIQPSPMGIRTPHTLIQSLTDGSDLEAANDIDMGEHPSAEPVYRPLYVLRPALVKPVSFGLLLLIGLVAVLVLRGSQSTGENSVADGEQED